MSTSRRTIFSARSTTLLFVVGLRQDSAPGRQQSASCPDDKGGGGTVEGALLPKLKVILR